MSPCRRFVNSMVNASGVLASSKISTTPSLANMKAAKSDIKLKAGSTVHVGGLAVVESNRFHIQRIQSSPQSQSPWVAPRCCRPNILQFDSQSYEQTSPLPAQVAQKASGSKPLSHAHGTVRRQNDGQTPRWVGRHVIHTCEVSIGCDNQWRCLVGTVIH